jgi:hypothetical protein
MAQHSDEQRSSPEELRQRLDLCLSKMCPVVGLKG